MTMPDERTCALRSAREFLVEVMLSDECPPAFRKEAKAILRHYPSALDIAQQSRRYDPHSSAFCWLGPERQDWQDNPAGS